MSERESVAIREATPLDYPKISQLYHDAGWLNYTNYPAMLDAALRNSRTVLVAVQQTDVLGVIRAVGDGASILYIQDLIVRQDQKRRGIGTRLLLKLDALYPDVYQKVLLTDDTPVSRAFYEHSGFQHSKQIGCMAMIKIKPPSA
ncbi:MAG TPA: GNAT family N-acetyltransferase [Candidatus Limiplasma sp.]|nr:GNAT family N-acetyltransferase [Candidatus Limiplasma sp.]HRX07929.1 GNAT family N-acetyltransferase [Candidatus Limiplasma sp.]